MVTNVNIIYWLKLLEPTNKWNTEDLITPRKIVHTGYQH